MDSYDRLIGKTLFEMKFNYYDNALREYSKDNIWFQSYNQLKYGIEDTCQYSYLKKCEQNYLYEGLLHTMDPNKALSKLKKYFDGFIHHAGIDYNPLQKDKTPLLYFYIYCDDYDDEYNKDALINLESIIYNLGYFIAAKKRQNGNYVFMLHPKFIYELTDYVYKECDGILYHITDYKTYQKIQKNGLIPRSKQFNGDNYPDRVYFYLKYNYNKLESYAKDLFKNKQNINNAVILKIDLKTRGSYIEGNKATMYRFFDDPKGWNSVFTYENIDPKCISLDREIKDISI